MSRFVEDNPNVFSTTPRVLIFQRPKIDFAAGHQLDPHFHLVRLARDRLERLCHLGPHVQEQLVARREKRHGLPVNRPAIHQRKPFDRQESLAESPASTDCAESRLAVDDTPLPGVQIDRRNANDGHSARP